MLVFNYLLVLGLVRDVGVEGRGNGWLCPEWLRSSTEGGAEAETETTQKQEGSLGSKNITRDFQEEGEEDSGTPTVFRTHPDIKYLSFNPHKPL